MISEDIKKQVISIWDKYIDDNKKILDNKGVEYIDIDSKRIDAIVIIKKIINDFLNNKIDIGEFKTAIDSYNKQNNLWGFTSIKGQMFFNILFKNNDTEEQLKKLTKVLKETISEPKDIKDALKKVESLDIFCLKIFSTAKDKRKAPNPGSVCYFLSYFWQIHNYQKWPIMYSSIIISLTDIGLWKEPVSQKEAYNAFFSLNEEIKKILSIHTKNSITNWEAEHSFWKFRKVTGSPKSGKHKIETTEVLPSTITQPVFKPNFEISDYIIPKVIKLIDLGNQTDKTSASKGSEYEKLVAEIFKQLDFEVEILGQGKGRNPDAIIKFREENTAFIVDAKAYSSGYSLGIDDRAIKEYINHYCPKLQKEGYKKIGFIIVSNSFKSNFDGFINDITWNTDIKRFVLLTSEALLYLLAYKTKEKLTLSVIIESIIGFGNVVSSQNVIEKFADV